MRPRIEVHARDGTWWCNKHQISVVEGEDCEECCFWQKQRHTDTMKIGRVKPAGLPLWVWWVLAALLVWAAAWYMPIGDM